MVKSEHRDVSAGGRADNGAARAPRYRPIVKWAGGKRRLLPHILASLPTRVETYYEPFVGGGAVFFALASEGRFRQAVLGDLNRELVDVYRSVKTRVRVLVRLLRAHAERHNREYFYEVRQLDPSQLDREQRAARLIYLNKTGYNGLYRVNRSGQFNVPFGRYKNPTICDEARLLAAAHALRGVSLKVQDFQRLSASAAPGDAVYFDPPYVPVSRTASFTAYHRDEFGQAGHERLAAVFTELSERQVACVLSNSMTPLTRALYRGRHFKVQQVQVGRSINSQGSARGQVPELLVRNAPCGPRSRST